MQSPFMECEIFSDLPLYKRGNSDVSCALTPELMGLHANIMWLECTLIQTAVSLALIMLNSCI